MLLNVGEQKWSVGVVDTNVLIVESDIPEPRVGRLPEAELFGLLDGSFVGSVDGRGLAARLEALDTFGNGPKLLVPGQEVIVAYDAKAMYSEGRGHPSARYRSKALYGAYDISQVVHVVQVPDALPVPNEAVASGVGLIVSP